MAVNRSQSRGLIDNRSSAMFFLASRPISAGLAASVPAARIFHPLPENLHLD